jgi:glycosyltransferase 2 family protein
MSSFRTAVTPEPVDAPTTAQPKFWQPRFVRIAGSAVVLALLFMWLPFSKVWSAIRGISPALALGLLGGYMVLHLLGVLKWRILLNLAGAGLSFPRAIQCYYAGLFANNFLPSLVGGDFVRGGLAFRFSGSKAAVVLGSLIDRLGDVVGLASVAAAGTLFIPGSLDPQNRKVFWAVGGILLVAGVTGAGALFALPARRLPHRVRRIMVKFRRGIRAMYRSPGTVLFCLLLGIVLQTTQVVINYWIGNASGLHVPFGVWLFAWPLAKLSALLPLTQGGIGVREGALVILLTPFGAPRALTFAAGLVFEAITIVGGLLAGIVAFLIARFGPEPGAALTHGR